MSNNLPSGEYIEFFNHLKEKVALSRYKAARTVNRGLIQLYHYIGNQILSKQAFHGWGSKIINTLSKDLSIAFPEMKGFSVTNLHNMRRFSELNPNPEFLQQAAGELPWYHHVVIMEKIKDLDERIFYIQNAVQYGWSRPVLIHQIALNLYKRQGKAINNFKANLPSPHSALANQTLKDPYIFDFLSIGKEAHEREIEKSLIQHMEKFLIELGDGFAFVGRQYHLEINHRDFYIDLLFYHLKLRCYIVIELKADEFEPEHAGKMNFYLSAVDDLLKIPSDNPSIGLILCKTKDHVLAEYTLRDMNKAIGLSEYRLNEALPDHLSTDLPTIKELEDKLAEDISSPNIELTIEWQEDRASEKIFPELKEHFNYIDKIYEFCFEVQHTLNGKTDTNVTALLRAQMMVLMRITDFLRCVRFNTIKGYPEQAGTLAASIFELAHTALYFSHTPKAVKLWLSNNSINDTMPQLLGVKNYKQLVKKNYENAGEAHFDMEYKVYSQLCWMKHSHPKMQDIIKTDNKLKFQVGPYMDERSINHAWFSIEHSGRLVTLVLNSLSLPCDTTSLKLKLVELEKTRVSLNQKALDRFGSNDPFLE